MASPLKTPFLWWRFLLVAAPLGFVGWGFAAAYYSVPAPTRSEQVVFWLFLVLVFLETNQAGWYRRHDPWELRALPYVLQIGKWILIAVAIVAALLLVVFIFNELASDIDARTAGSLLLIFIVLVLLLLIIMTAPSESRDE